MDTLDNDKKYKKIPLAERKKLYNNSSTVKSFKLNMKKILAKYNIALDEDLKEQIARLDRDYEYQKSKKTLLFLHQNKPEGRSGSSAKNILRAV